MPVIHKQPNTQRIHDSFPQNQVIGYVSKNGIIQLKTNETKAWRRGATESTTRKWIGFCKYCGNPYAMWVRAESEAPGDSKPRYCPDHKSGKWREAKVVDEVKALSGHSAA